jgi:pimeloyl-ACP methyl ester carboxylesterase
MKRSTSGALSLRTMDNRPVSIEWAGRIVKIEAAWAGPPLDSAAPVVFLHEGLGSVALWRDFPARLCAALGRPGLVYSRPGYGRSTARAPGERWRPDFMHRQALEVLPAFLEAIGLAAGPVHLFGHSDGASIALLFAAHHAERVASVTVLAPHTFVEDITIEGIERTRSAFVTGGLRDRLARFHDDVDSAFWGWCDVWLDPAFRAWTIEAEVGAIRAPLLAIQGVDDEYGTLDQLDRLGARVPHTQRLVLPGCGHSPHRDQPEAVIAAVQRLIGDA